MKSIKVLGLCLAAVFAFSAVAVASASAQQEAKFMKCAKAEKVNKKYTGGYNDKRCTEVNVAGGGKYAATSLTGSVPFEGKSKTTTFFYRSKSTGKIVWKLTCKKDAIAGEIGSATELEGLITFEKCTLANEATHAKAVKCPNIAVGFVGDTRVTYPAETSGVLLYVLWPKPYTCEGVSFKQSSAMVLAGEVEATSKGEVVALKVQANGEQNIDGWIEFFAGEEEVLWPYENETEVTVGATKETLGLGVEGTEPVAPKKEVVLIGG